MHAEPTGVVGLVLARPAHLLGVEPFFMEFIAGIEEPLADRDMSVLLHVVADHEAEIAAYRRWADRSLVDAVVVVNLVANDPRTAALTKIKLPAIVVGDSDLPSVRTDHDSPVADALGHLLALGHRRIARVTGPSALLHTQARTDAFLTGCAKTDVEPVIVEGDYSEEAGTKLTTALLTSQEPPTAILYDNDVMAVAGLSAATALGAAVPDHLSLVAWDDSTLCRLASPALTTMSVDVHQFGVSVAESVLELIGGAEVKQRWSPTARYLERETTAPPSRA
ncbi:LacI family DNA-binding transcriptional regulator [Lentzea sp. JNUCC 0626]|uniref:LacI family DNA-binding transcriptional regulator n=1 Tax=Lentzea sp. JNUCC 0626 TaxID=3367513 RepID=UPI003749B1FB